MKAEQKHPILLYILSIIHFFERFSYYGVRSLLLLYLITELDFTDHKSYAVFGVYTTLTYVTPLLGGYISDKSLGVFSALWGGLLCMLIGYVILVALNNQIALFMGLGLIATGSGLYKPNMNALIGSLYTKEDPQKGAAYTIFYVYQNIGSFLAPLICGSVGLSIGWHYGFAIPAVGVVIALLIFIYSDKLLERFVDPLEQKKPLLKTFAYLIFGAVCLSAFLGSIIYYGEESLDIILALSIIYGAVFWKHYCSCNRHEKKDMLLILLGVMAVALSGALISHGDTVFTLFMTRNVDPMIVTFQVPITFIQSIDPLTIIILGSLTPFLWKIFGRQQISDLGKILIGFMLIVGAYAYLYILCTFFHHHYLVSVIPFALGLVILSASDIFIYPNVLTFCSKRSPSHLIGVVMGFVVFGMGLSQLFGTYLARISSVQVITKGLSESWKAYQKFFLTMTSISFLVFVVLLLCMWRVSQKEKNGPE